MFLLRGPTGHKCIPQSVTDCNNVVFDEIKFIIEYVVVVCQSIARREKWWRQKSCRDESQTKRFSTGLPMSTCQQYSAHCGGHVIECLWQLLVAVFSRAGSTVVQIEILIHEKINRNCFNKTLPNLEIVCYTNSSIFCIWGGGTSKKQCLIILVQ